MQDLGHTGLNNLLAAYEDKSAKAVCTFGFSQGPGHEPILFQGITDVCLKILSGEEISPSLLRKGLVLLTKRFAI